jgi:chromosome segregation ATPase
VGAPCDNLDDARASRVTTRKPKPAAHSEDELLEQWDFLDAMVERQAAALRAGVQDVEEDDQALVAVSELEELRRQLEALRRDHEALVGAHGRLGDEHQELAQRYVALQASTSAASIAAAQTREPELEELRSRLTASEAGRRDLEAAHLAARRRGDELEARMSSHQQETQELRRRLESAARAESAVAAAQADQRHWQQRARHLELELDAARAQFGAELADLTARLAHAQAALTRWQATHAEMLVTLRGAHDEVESLRAQVAVSRDRRRGLFHWRR